MAKTLKEVILYGSMGYGVPTITKATDLTSLQEEPAIKAASLPEGAQLLEAKLYNPNNPLYSHIRIVLCKWRDEYVTWIHNTSLGDGKSSQCCEGHYFKNLTAAAKDFESRGIKQEQDND
jgi:hypothetical protein